MAKPSKHPPPVETRSASTPRAAKQPVSDPEQPLTQSDYELLCGLDPHVRGNARVRSDMLALLMESETNAALTKYASVLTKAGVLAEEASTSLSQVNDLLRLRRRLELAQALVTRHIQSAGEPAMTLASDLHQFVEGTPTHSPLRVAFSLFVEQWKGVFRGGRQAKAPVTTGTNAGSAPK